LQSKERDAPLGFAFNRWGSKNLQRKNDEANAEIAHI